MSEGWGRAWKINGDHRARRPEALVFPFPRMQKIPRRSRFGSHESFKICMYSQELKKPSPHPHVRHLATATPRKELAREKSRSKSAEPGAHFPCPRREREPPAPPNRPTITTNRPQAIDGWNDGAPAQSSGQVNLWVRFRQGTPSSFVSARPGLALPATPALPLLSRCPAPLGATYALALWYCFPPFYG